jgi:hypothetical protein
MYLSFNTEKATSYQSSYTSNPFATKVNSNNTLWNGYFTTDNEKSSKMTTAEGIEKLNSMKKNTEQAKEAKKVEQEKKKMSKLLQKMQKENAIKMTKKQSNALQLIKANPDLAFLHDGIITKLNAVLAQSANLLSTVIESLDSDLTSDKLNSINSSVTKAREQLVKDGQKILSGIVKIGAYSEAMLQVDDKKKKDKYQNAAITIAGNLPDVSKQEVKLSSSSNSVEDIENNEETDSENIEISQENSTDTINPFASQTDNDEQQVTENVTEDKTSKSEDVEDTDDTDDELSDNVSNSTKQESKDEKDSEVETLKQEVKDELKKQKTGRKIIKDANDKILSSVLFD